MAAGRSERMYLLGHRNSKGIHKISLWTCLRSQPVNNGCVANIDEDIPTEVVGKKLICSYLNIFLQDVLDIRSDFRYPNTSDQGVFGWPKCSDN